MNTSRGRVPILPLSYEMKDKAVEKELLMDYATGDLYIANMDAQGQFEFISLADAVMKKVVEGGVDSKHLTVEIIDPVTGEKVTYRLPELFNDILTKLNTKPDFNGNKIAGAIVSIDANGKLIASTVNIDKIKDPATPTNDGYMSKEHADKLNKIEAGAKPYEHPSSHPATMITTDETHRFVTDTQIASFGDKYTKIETDNIVSNIVNGIDWKASVPTYDSIAATYPNPEDGWTVNVDDTDITYRYTGSKWIAISANSVPKSTATLDGLMSKESYVEMYTNIPDKFNTKLDKVNEVAGKVLQSKADGTIENSTFDISNITPLESNGGVWYNNSSTLNTARRYHTATGTATNCMVQGGRDDALNTTESYNGSVWTINSSTLNTGRSDHSATGTSTSCMIQGGINTRVLNTTESYNGSVWTTNTSTLNVIRSWHSVTGTATNCMIQAGNSDGTKNTTESYNGSIWTTNSSTLNAARYAHSATGTSTNCMVQGGISSTMITDTTESYNGSIWTTSTLLNTSRSNHTAISNIMIQGGNSYSSTLNTTESYNGSVWTTNTSTLNSVRCEHSATGTSIMVQGGNNDSGTLNTTESYMNVNSFNSLRELTRNIDNRTSDMEKYVLRGDALWSVNSNTLNIYRNNHSATGTATNCMLQGGLDDNYTYLSSTESYNGSVWTTNSSTLNNSRSYHSATGTTTNCMVQGGSGTLNTTESYNGSVWTTNSSKLNIGRNTHTATGTVTNCMVQGGYGTNLLNNTESYNGNVWTTNGSTLNTDKHEHSATGTATNCMVQGGQDNNVSALNSTESYNGNVWTTNSSTLNNSRSYHSATGTATDCMVQGGLDDSGRNALNTTESYNGSVWTTTSSALNTTRSNHSATGTGTNCMIQGGTGNSSTLNTTESYNTDMTLGDLYSEVLIHKEKFNTISEDTIKILQDNKYLSETTDVYLWAINTATLNTDRSQHSATGTSTNCMIQAGNSDSNESYNGNIWTIDSSKLNKNRSYHSATGTSTNCMVQGGYLDISNHVTETESYNGNIWTIDNSSLNVIRSYHSATGTSTNCMLQGGLLAEATTESYNGSVWTTNSSKLNTARRYHSATGTSTNCMVQGGRDTGTINTTESYNGNIWTANSSTLNTARSYHSATGTITNCMVQGSNNIDTTNITESYNGNIWTIDNSILNTGRLLHSATGTSTSIMVQGGVAKSNNRGLNITESYEKHSVISLFEKTIDNENKLEKIPAPKYKVSSILAESWVSQDPYKYYAKINDADITSTDVVNVNIPYNYQDLVSFFGFSSITESYDGGFTVYCDIKPTMNISIEYIIQPF